MRITPAKEEAIRLAREYPHISHRQLARVLNAEFKTKTFDQCHDLIRNSRGREVKAKLQAKKHAERLPTPEMPKSLAEPWKKYYMPDGLTLVLSDVHIPYHYDMALRAAVEYGKKIKPKSILLNGDAADFHSISDWERDPRKRDFETERVLVVQFLQWLRSSFPDALIVYKLGNHEERWTRLMWQKGLEIYKIPFLQIENLLELPSMGIQLVDNKRPVMIGKLPVLHGHELPKGIASPVNAARGAYMRTKHSVLVGHSHQSSSHTEPDMWHEEVVAWSTGCLCDLTPSYTRINKWNHGFAVVESNESGDYDVTNLRIGSNGEIRTS